MQREDIVPVTSVPSILTAIYQDSPFVYEAYSKFEQRLFSFSGLDVLLAHIKTELSAGRKYFDLAVHYPDTAGYTYIKNIDLIPEKCGGAKWREKIEGWGLIQVQITYQDSELANCRIAVNSEKRALAWAETLSDLKAPALWNWRQVEKHTRRLIRVLRKGT